MQNCCNNAAGVKRAWLVTCGAVLMISLGCGGSVRAPHALPAATILPMATPCRVPFDSYQAFLTFVAQRRRNDSRDILPTPAQLEAVYPREAFTALAARDGHCLRLGGTGSRARGFVLIPAPLPLARRPLLIFLHGGLGQDSRIVFGDLIELQTFAARGYTVLAPEYRPGESVDGVGGAENAEIDARIAEALTLPQVDPAQVVVMGVSRGAVNAFQLARRRPTVRAVAAWSGLVDARANLAARPELIDEFRAAVPDFDTHRDSALAERSAITWAARLTMPTLLLHGTADWRVDVGQARRFAAEHGELITYEGDGHELWAHRAEARAVVDQFFRRSLLMVLN